MTPHEFIAKWQKAQLSERSAYQQHSCELCDVLGQPKPAQADPEGAWYTFERGVDKTTGQKGSADVFPNEAPRGGGGDAFTRCRKVRPNVVKLREPRCTPTFIWPSC